MGEALRATDEITALWAGKGFPIPPGELAYQTQQIQQKAQGELAASSREAAIESFKAELQMIQIAIGAAKEARSDAVAAAGDYVKTMAMSQTTSTHLLTNKAQAQNGLISAVATMLNARTNAADTIFKSNLANATLAQDASSTSAKLAAADRHKRGDIAVAAGDAVARQTAAMLNNLHTSVGVQGTEKL